MKEVALVAVSTSPARELYRIARDLWDEGCAVLPVDTRLPDAGQRIRDLRPSAIIEAGERSDLEAGLPVPADTALVIATSGTKYQRRGGDGSREGGPALKAAVISHTAMTASAQRVNETLGTGGSTWLCCLPLSHIAGLGILYRSMVSGVDPVIHDRFQVEVVTASETTDAISLVPRMLQLLLESETDLTRFTAVLVGGGPTPPGLLKRALEKGAQVRTSYGMTETCGGCFIDGVAIRDVQARVNSSGAIEIAGPVLADGYRLRDDLTESRFRDGWFTTDDYGLIDESGTLHVTGRVDDAIMRAGNKIHPQEIQDALLTHPLVDDAVVLAITDDDSDEQLAAVVAGDIDSDTLLIEHLEKQLPRYKIPQILRLVSSVPRTPMGKPDIAEIRRLLSSG